MITKESFVKIMNALDEYYVGDIYKAFQLLQIEDANAITALIDVICEAIDKDIDPRHFAKYDDLTYDCGSYIFEWLFGEGAFQEECKTAEELYDYIMKAYGFDKKKS